MFWGGTEAKGEELGRYDWLDSTAWNLLSLINS